MYIALTYVVQKANNACKHERAATLYLLIGKWGQLLKSFHPVMLESSAPWHDCHQYNFHVRSVSHKARTNANDPLRYLLSGGVLQCSIHNQVLSTKDLGDKSSE